MKPDPIRRATTRNGLMLMLVGLLSVYVVVRGVLVPITIDEAITYLDYVKPGVWIPGEAKIDANNHLLNSFLAIICDRIFGSEPWSMRLPNMLAGIIYFLYSFLFARSMKSWKSAIAVFLGLVGSHFLIDFFGVARGYGLSFAFLVISLYHLVRWWEKAAIADLVMLVAAAVLAVFANLSMLVPCGVILGSTFLFILIRGLKDPNAERIIPVLIVLLFSLPILFFIDVARDLQDSGLLYIGGSEGFWNTTGLSLLHGVYGNIKPLLPIIPLVLILPLLVFLWKLVGDRFSTFMQSNSIVFIMLLLTVAGQIALHHVMGVNYPKDRVALLYLPLVVIGTTKLFDSLSYPLQRRLMYIPLICIAGIPIKSIGEINLTHVAQWDWDAGSRQYFEYLVTETENMGRQPTVAAERLQSLSLEYYNTIEGFPLRPSLTYWEARAHADFVLSRPNTPEQLEGYDVASENTISNTVLLKRKKPQNRTVVLERATDPVSTNEEYFSFYDGVIDSLMGKDLLIEVTCELRNQLHPLNAWVGFEVSDSKGVQQLYTSLRVMDLIGNGRSESSWLNFHFICPADGEDRHYVKLYLWNIDEKRIELSNVSVTVLKLD